MYEIAGKSLKYFEKEKNGDSWYYEDIKSEKLLIAMVADGVSQQPCDWMASNLSCNEFMDNFKNSNLEDIPLRIKESIIAANKTLTGTEGKCKNLCSTFTLLIWNYDKNIFFTLNIGDSRIFRCRNQSIEQITTDDSLKRTKEIVTSIGRRTVDASVLTRFMGMQTTGLEPVVHQLKIARGDLLILSTDGFYNARIAFKNDMIKLSSAEILQQNFEEVFNRYSLLAKDDMTVIMIKVQG